MQLARRCRGGLAVGVCGYQYLSGALRGAMGSEEAVSARDGAGKAG